ncbi:hypothetical protein Hanom_Chr12g01168691 [Helianthus anomalus]
MNVTSFVLEFLPSKSNTGNDIWPRGKLASLQKPVSGWSTGSKRALSSWSN